MNKITKTLKIVDGEKVYTLFKNNKRFAMYGTKNIVRDEKKEVKK